VTAVAALPSVDTLVAGVVDYAGLFPPASLDMASAVRNYHAYRSDAHAPMLGRFVVPVSRLPEFFAEAHGVLPQRPTEGSWQLAALAGTDLVADLRHIDATNAVHADGARDRVIVDVLEVKAATIAEVETLRQARLNGLELYVEVPLVPDPAPLLAALAGGTLRAKMRTGGVTADAIPPVSAVAAFMVGAARAGVQFKATAGLHHAIRGRHPLTYASDSAEAVMHGFINVFVAAALAQAGGSTDELCAVLEETDPAKFRFGPDSLHWGGRQFTIAQLRATRERFARSFGSCSFREPVQELHDWGLL
jgi:hypothetical protein